MALAMVARAYGFKANRTSLYEYSFNRRDVVFLIVMLALTAAVIFA
jgi:energy-coupling factor transporter transmembrane protein EcfT